MPVSFRPRGSDGPMYSPERDFAYCYVGMVEAVIKSFDIRAWPQLLDFLELHGVTMVELIQAKDAYCRYLNTVCEDPKETVEDVITRAGWYDVHMLARTAWLTMLGTIMTGQFYQGLRDVTLQDTPPSDRIQALVRAGYDARRAMYGKATPAENFAAELTELVDVMELQGVSLTDVRKCMTPRTVKALWPSP